METIGGHFANSDELYLILKSMYQGYVFFYEHLLCRSHYHSLELKVFPHWCLVSFILK